MTRSMRNLNGFLFAFCLVFLLVYGPEASADKNRGPDVEVETLVETIVNTDIAGDTLGIEGDRAFAVGGSSFDVDINECLASKATNIVVVGWQSLHENPTCIADGLDARGNHDAAARVRCKHVDTIVDSFTTFDDCISAFTMPPRSDPPPPPPPPTVDKDDDEDDSHGHDYDVLQQQLAALVDDKKRTDKVAANYASKRREQRQEDRLYAQQLIEEIQQIEESPAQVEEPPNDN